MGQLSIKHFKVIYYINFMYDSPKNSPAANPNAHANKIK